MKKFNLAFFVLLIYSQSFAQVENPIAIAPVYFNILYVGIENPLDVAVSGINIEDVSLTITKGTIINKGEGSYIVKVPEVGNAEITVYRDAKYLDSRKFKCKALPNPYPQLIINGNSFNEENIKKENFLLASHISAELNLDIDISFHVTEFTVSSIRENGYSVEKRSNTALFTPDQKKLIRKTNIGRKIYISDIKCKGPDGKTRKLNPLVFIIQ